MPRMRVLSRNRGRRMKSPSRALLAALLAVAAVLAALTFSAGAQTPGGELGPDQSGSTEAAEGRIIARVQDRTGADGVDDYRIEFGFFPEWALDEAESWPEAIASRSGWLPSSRFLTKSRIDALAAADNRSWLRSSLISVPAQSAQAPGGAQTQITGRVVARYNPDSDGRLRDRFGFGDLRLEFLFVPEWAFTDTSSTQEAVERLGQDGLPRARYLSVATIDTRRDVWLRSSVVNVPLRAPVVVIEQPQAPVIDGISCIPSSLAVDESLTCTATLSGGAPETWAWRTANGSGSGVNHSTSFSKAGDYAVSLTVTNEAGSDSDSITINVAEPAEEPSLQAPVIDGLSCAPSSLTVGEETICTAELSGGAPESWVWDVLNGIGGSGSGGRYTTSFSRAGEQTVSLTVINAAGRDRESITVSVSEALHRPVIDGIDCSPSSPSVGEETICVAELNGGVPESYSWSGGSAGGDSDYYTTSFGTAGSKTVSLTVTNWAGSDTESITINVAEPAEEPTLQAPVIDSLSCAPSSLTVGEETICTAELSGGAPESWVWDVDNGIGGSGSGGRYTTSFSRAGEQTVSLTVINAAGRDRESITVSVSEALHRPVIDGIDCSPSSPSVGEETICTAELNGSAPESYIWSGGSAGGDSDYYTTSFSKAGEYTVSLTVTNWAGSDTESATVSVAALQAPVIDSISCSPSSPGEAHRVYICEAILSGGAPDSHAWSGSEVDEYSAQVHVYTAFFFSPGSKTITLTVTNTAGSDSDSITINVEEPAEEPTLQAPAIDSLSCAPSSLTVGEETICTAELSGGAPESWVWDVDNGSGGSGSGGRYTTSFSRAGEQTVSLTVINDAGRDRESTTVSVAAPVQGPVIYSITCSPPSPTVGESVTCTAELGGGNPDTYAWSVGGGSGSGDSYTTSFDTAGGYTVSLTVTNSGGDDTESTMLRVAARSSQAPVIDSISCDRPYTSNFQANCTATLSGGAPTSRDWSGGGPTSLLAGHIYRAQFLRAGTGLVAPGEYTISLTVRNASGSDSKSITLTVTKPAPYINYVRCSPTSPPAGESVTCTAHISNGAAESYAWSGGASSGSGATYTTSFATVGEHTVLLTATNSTGSDSWSGTLTVTP